MHPGRVNRRVFMSFESTGVLLSFVWVFITRISFLPLMKQEGIESLTIPARVTGTSKHGVA